MRYCTVLSISIELGRPGTFSEGHLNLRLFDLNVRVGADGALVTVHATSENS